MSEDLVVSRERYRRELWPTTGIKLALIIKQSYSDTEQDLENISLLICD
jgi:hypothetical protein